MLLFLQHKALKAPTISITTGYFAPSAFRRCQVLAPAGGTGRFMPLAGSDVIPAKSLCFTCLISFSQPLPSEAVKATKKSKGSDIKLFISERPATLALALTGILLDNCHRETRSSCNLTGEASRNTNAAPHPTSTTHLGSDSQDRQLAKRSWKVAGAERVTEVRTEEEKTWPKASETTMKLEDKGENCMGVGFRNR
ncbi:hypothetical protein EYF80_011294 [Liparis tanakae]|uniref:Uncharacterized protein n=1 Tax=Liparis tanakae TaxID=230148 RepID=A0A4Z2IL39_9TELE|nr:hypothetical protein EYF80_011294 [Liparis tanakae]